MEYVFKSHGISLLKRLINKAKKNPLIKHISLPVEQATELMEEVQKPKIDPYIEYTTKSNSVNAASVVLCIKPKELLERLNSPLPSKVLAELAEARTRIKMLEEAGEALAKTSKFQTLIERWDNIKTL
ncbi:hypothetical protein CCP3SC1AL1_3500005 [Gammaproteobacteria bacterium]